MKLDKCLLEGAVRVHLYDSKNILRPRGSMEKESIGLYLIERLRDSYESWTNDEYGDNPEIKDLLNNLYKNLLSESMIAWENFINEIISSSSESEIIPLSISIMSAVKPPLDSDYIPWFLSTITSTPETFIKAINTINKYDKKSEDYEYFTILHRKFVNEESDYKKLYNKACDPNSEIGKLAQKLWED